MHTHTYTHTRTHTHVVHTPCVPLYHTKKSRVQLCIRVHAHILSYRYPLRFQEHTVAAQQSTPDAHACAHTLCPCTLALCACTHAQVSIPAALFLRDNVAQPLLSLSSDLSLGTDQGQGCRVQGVECRVWCMEYGVV